MVPVPPDFSPKGSSSRAQQSTTCSPWHPMCTPMGRQHAGGTPQWDTGLVPEAVSTRQQINTVTPQCIPGICHHSINHVTGGKTADEQGLHKSARSHS